MDDHDHDHTLRRATWAGIALGLIFVAVMFVSAASDRPQAETPCQYGMCEARR